MSNRSDFTAKVAGAPSSQFISSLTDKKVRFSLYWVSDLTTSTEQGQAIDPFSGQTVGKKDPMWHWEFNP
jgi:hypothetical protein